MAMHVPASRADPRCGSPGAYLADISHNQARLSVRSVPQENSKLHQIQPRAMIVALQSMQQKLDNRFAMIAA